MSRTCPTCQKGSLMVGGYRNDVRATKYQPIGKRRKLPNLQWATKPDGTRVRICTTCIRKSKQLVK